MADRFDQAKLSAFVDSYMVWRRTLSDEQVASMKRGFQEYKDNPARAMEELEQVYTDCDKDQDGTLNLAEYTEMMKYYDEKTRAAGMPVQEFEGRFQLNYDMMNSWSPDTEGVTLDDHKTGGFVAMGHIRGIMEAEFGAQ